MSREFKTLFSYLKKLQSRYFHTLCAFQVYEAIEELQTPNITGEEAYENVKAMNRFKNFFLSSKEALRVYFLLELAKLFDESQESLHISKIVNYAASNIRKLSKKDFLKFHKGRTFLEELFVTYKEIDREDLKEIKFKLDKHARILKKLDTYRNQYLAHDDRKKKKVKITSGEIIKLFKLVEDIFGLFSSRLDFSTTSYSHIKECKEDTKRVIDYLKRFESYRLKEIEAKYANMK